MPNYRVVLRILDSIYHSVEAEAVGDRGQAGEEQEKVQSGPPMLSHGNPPEIKPHKPKGKWYKSFDWWKSRLEIVAVFAAIALAALTYCQWRDAHENFRIDERAWVSPFQPCIEKPHARAVLADEGCAEDPDKGPAIFKVLYKNNGKTYATNVSSWIGTTPILAELQTPEEGEGGPSALLAPGAVANTSTPPIQSIGLTQLAAHPIYVYGQIWYRDIFGGRHWTQFCFTHFSDSGKAFGVCPIHNTYDGDQQGSNAQK